MNNHIAILYPLKVSSVAPIVFKKDWMAFEDNKNMLVKKFKDYFVLVQGDN